MQGWSSLICCRNFIYRYIYTKFGVPNNNSWYFRVELSKFLLVCIEASFAYLKKIAIFGRVKTPTFFQRTPHIYFLKYKLQNLTTYSNMMVLGDCTTDFQNFARVMIYALLKTNSLFGILKCHKSSPEQKFKNLLYNHLYLSFLCALWKN